MRITLLALPLALAAPSRPAPRPRPAPVLVPRNAQLVEGKYIVVMKTSASGATAVASAVSGIAAGAEFTYSHSFHGFAARLTPGEVEQLRGRPEVDYIEQDAVFKAFETQPNADWGLARLSNAAGNSTTYTFDESAGDGTCAYVVDTGVDQGHPDFEGRAKMVANFADKEDTDANGHGTHVSGTIGSKTFGVAKKTRLLGVKVLGSGGSGSTSGVVAGMDFVAKDAAGQSCPKGVVVNMSLGGGSSRAVNTAAASMVHAGLFLAVAAGNDGADAGEYSPASEPSACTVGATGRDDSLASYSNVGSLVDVLAPGSNITSTWVGGGQNTISGTSMASPHVAGLGAYFLGTGEKVAGLCQLLKDRALKGAISNVPSGTANLLINNGHK